MTDYPNREHQNADKAATRRALSSLADIIEDAGNLKRRIENGYEPHGSDAQRIADKAIALAVNLSALETLRDVREWAAADRQESAAGLLAKPALLLAMADALGLRPDLDLAPANRDADLARRVAEKAATAAGTETANG